MSQVEGEHNHLVLLHEKFCRRKRGGREDLQEGKMPNTGIQATGDCSAMGRDERAFWAMAVAEHSRELHLSLEEKAFLKQG